jgi:hypothetical protein
VHCGVDERAPCVGTGRPQAIKGIRCDAGLRGRARAAAQEWRAARDPVDRPRPDRRVVQRVQGQTPLGFGATLRCSTQCPKGAVARGDHADGEVSRHLVNMLQGVARVV